MTVVRVSDETTQRLQALANGFRGDPLGTPDKVIGMLLDFYEGEHSPADVIGAEREPGGKRYLIAAYDVTELTDDEIEHLGGEAHAMSDRSEGHPSVGCVSGVIDPSTIGTYVGTFLKDDAEIHAIAKRSQTPALDLSGS